MTYTLGNRIKEERLKLNLNQEELGYKINVSKQAISGWENGYRTPDIEMIIKLSNLFNCSTDYLLDNSIKSSSSIFGEKLKQLRESSNLQQKDLADELYVHRGAISNWENNKREPDIQTLIKISKYFNVSIDYLLGNSNTSSNTLNSNGKRIKKLRKLYNMTSKELSELLGISQVYLSYIENEKRIPSLELIEKTCEIFNISLNTFFDKNNNEKTLGDYIEFYLSKNNINYKNITPDKKEEFAKSLVNLFIILNNK